MPRPTVLLSLIAACSPSGPTARVAPPADPPAPALAAAAPTPAPAVVPFEPAPPESPRRPIPPPLAELAARLAALPVTGHHLAVTLDRPLYRPGETVWARIWDLAAGPLDGSARRDEVVYVQLVDPRGTVVRSLAYRHTGAGASAALDLPPQLAGGLYAIRATVGQQQVERPLVVAAFEEPRIRKELDLLRDAYGPGDEVVAALTVASSGRGPLVDHPVRVVVQVEGRALPPIEARTDTRGEATLRFRLPEEMRRPDAVLTVLVEEEGWTEAIAREIPVVLDAVQLEWFPEGGDWVEGLPGRVYLRARDRHGEPADVAGVIEDAAGRAVATFRTVHDGLGRFELTPRPGERYFARITEPVPSATPIPVVPALSEGCVLRAFDDLDGERAELRAAVWCTEARDVFVLAEIRGRPFAPAFATAGPDRPAVVHLRAPERATALLQGVARLTVVDADAQPIAERLVYRNRHRALRIGITADRARYGPRDEVVLTVTARDPDGEPVDADLALAVADDRLLKHADDEHGDLRSQLHLDPWLAGTLEDSAWYFDPDEPEAGLGLDLVLGTFGWRRFAPSDPEAPPPPPDAGEAAREEEGRFGVRTAHLEADRALAENAGLLGALAAPADASGGIGGLFGVQGLGGHGIGLGGGGLAEGLGGLGTKGMGSGASGYGTGAGPYGPFGARGEGGLGAFGGDPIILGALDRDLVEAVVRRHLNQIRYCYQRELVKDPTVAGRIVTKFVIAKDGTVSAAQTKSSTMRNASVEQCIVGRFLRMQFPEPKGGGIVIVSFPFVFSPGDGSGWSPTPTFAAVREFPLPDYAGPPPVARTDFRSTVAWFPSIDTGEDGVATVRFPLADTVTTWRVTAEGVGGGHVGHAELELHSTLPFSLDVPLPTEVSFGDRLLLPIRLSNRGDRPLEVALDTRIAAPLAAEDGTGAQRIALAPEAGAVTVVPIAVPDVIGTAEVAVAASAAALSDRVSRTLAIAPRGFPHRWTAGGELADRAAHTFVIDEALPGGTEAKVTVYPNAVASLLEGLASMVRIPHGCFEQTSSSNHPNVLVLELLDRAGGGGGLLVDRTAALRAGYERLTGYQVATGGFETFGRGPGKEALSAYGLLQFTRMRRVFPEVDPAMVSRDVAFLLAARDGTGGYRASGVSAHLYGAAPKEVNDAYVTYALAETGHLREGPEIDRARDLARATRDPYLLALSALAIRHAHPSEATEAAARLAGLQAGDGSFPGAASSVERSGGHDLLVETTALATLALHRAGADRGAVRRALEWLASARRGSYGWGGTQATVLALEAIATVTGDDTAPRSGVIEVRVDGAPAGRIPYTGHERDGLVLDLARFATPGEHRIELVHEGDRPVPYALEATWRRDLPADAAGAPLAIETTLAADEVGLGETVRLVARIENPTAAPVASPLARIGLPAGVRVETKALEGLKERGRIAYFETRPREVTLYWEGFAPGETQEIAFDLVAEVPGTFTAPPSVVHPYYTTDARRWADGATLRIRP